MADCFRPGQEWLDTNGKPIQAHGLSVFYSEKDGVYYWFGENKEKTVGGARNKVWHWGVRCYASKDLYNWEDKGLIIPPQPDDLQSPLHPSYCMDRPHILYCEKTGKYVAWLKIMCGTTSQFMSVMQADDFLGPYEFVHRMNLNQAAHGDREHGFIGARLRKPRIETHHLGIGMNEKDPARLVFEGKAGPAIVVSLIDMGGRLRLIVQDIEAVKPILPMPNLPVARVMWRALPDLTTGVECWITAGGAHHTVLSYDVTADMMRDWARMVDIEFVHITKDTTPEQLEEELLVKDLIWKLK